MAKITIKFKNGAERIFPDERRPGGSYSNSIRFEGGFTIVKDVWDNSFCFPSSDIEEITERPSGYS